MISVFWLLVFGYRIQTCSGEARRSSEAESPNKHKHLALLVYKADSEPLGGMFSSLTFGNCDQRASSDF